MAKYHFLFHWRWLLARDEMCTTSWTSPSLAASLTNKASPRQLQVTEGCCEYMYIHVRTSCVCPSNATNKAEEELLLAACTYVQALSATRTTSSAVGVVKAGQDFLLLQEEDSTAERVLCIIALWFLSYLRQRIHVYILSSRRLRLTILPIFFLLPAELTTSQYPKLLAC